MVDHTQYDTTSILRTIEQRWNLAPLGTRDAKVNSLENTLDSNLASNAGSNSGSGPSPTAVVIVIGALVLIAIAGLGAGLLVRRGRAT